MKLAHVSTNHNYTLTRSKYSWLSGIEGGPIDTTELTRDNLVILLSNALEYNGLRLMDKSVDELLRHYEDEVNLEFKDSKDSGSRSKTLRDRIQYMGIMFPPRNGHKYTTIVRYWYTAHQILLDIVADHIPLEIVSNSRTKVPNPWTRILDAYNIPIKMDDSTEIDIPVYTRDMDIRSVLADYIKRVSAYKGIEYDDQVADAIVEGYISKARRKGTSNSNMIILYLVIDDILTTYNLH